MSSTSDWERIADEYPIKRPKIIARSQQTSSAKAMILAFRGVAWVEASEWLKAFFFNITMHTTPSVTNNSFVRRLDGEAGGGRATVLGLIPLDDDLEPRRKIDPSQTSPQQRVRAAQLDRPVHHLALCVRHIDIQPAVRVGPRYRSVE
jgi:hypothetical protein